MKIRRDRWDAVVCYTRDERKKRNVPERRSAGTSACETSSACTKEWLRSSEGKFLHELLAGTRERAFFVVQEKFSFMKK